MAGIAAVAVMRSGTVHASSPANAAPTASSAPVERAGDPDGDFGPTVPDKNPAPAPAPAGMVWILGGEFSMDTNSAVDSVCAQGGVTRDAAPIHRVYVDASWMDAAEVTKRSSRPSSRRRTT
jgi:formylglycine-generating enzyme required for sulfatase activity